jgi:hypothetical protein
MSPKSSAIILAATAKQEAATANFEECLPMTKCLFKRQNWISQNNFLPPNTKFKLEHKVAKVYIKGRSVDIQPTNVPKRDLFAFNQSGKTDLSVEADGLNEITSVEILTVLKDENELETVGKDPVINSNKPEPQKRKWVGEDAIDKEDHPTLEVAEDHIRDLYPLLRKRKTGKKNTPTDTCISACAR